MHTMKGVYTYTASCVASANQNLGTPEKYREMGLHKQRLA